MLVRNARRAPTLTPMKRESRLGRALWLVLLVLLGGYVVADFVRSPFSAPQGAAAVRVAAITIWVPAGEAGDEAGPVLTGAAAGLDLDDHTTVVKSIPGGSSQALISFLSRQRGGRGQLLAISSTTLADLAHDRQETLIPGVAEEAALARALLRRAKPVGMLASHPLEVAVERESPIRNGAELIASLRAAPGEQLFGIDDDTFSRDQLSVLVTDAGVDGEVHFNVFQSGSSAAGATAAGNDAAVLAGRPALRGERLHRLGWPLSTPQPRAWVALLARPEVSASELETVRTWIAELQRDRHWRANLRHEGRRAAAPGTRALARMIRHTAPADHLEQVAQRVEPN